MCLYHRGTLNFVHLQPLGSILLSRLEQLSIVLHVEQHGPAIGPEKALRIKQGLIGNILRNMGATVTVRVVQTQSESSIFVV